MKQNISHLICNLDLLYTGFSSGVIIWASEIKLDVLIANIYQEKIQYLKILRTSNMQILFQLLDMNCQN